MANALALETSPYLRQHAENPVDWLPWGDLALSRAVLQQRPLLVSIGYSSCHWCHVMERESFEDERVAALMNDRFVCVKVDREERPDIDAIYMEAVQAMTGQGGWPLNVFLTPDQMPFYGGTYFPPQPRSGMPSWAQVLSAVAEAWQERPEEISASAEQLRGRLSGAATLMPSKEPLQERALIDAVKQLSRSFDSANGGFGGAPKFPQPTAIELLLGEAALTVSPEAEAMALATLQAIVTGGIHDLLGGGFHRYAVDATWTVPHFEKMLYDNALLARACMRGFILSGRRELLDASLDTLSWALAEMRGPEGGFYSALDADSEGVEGAFYLWTTQELRELLGDDADAAIAWTGASKQGNFVDPHHPAPGRNVLSARGEAPDARTRRRIRERLMQARGLRARPDLDDKRLTAWNALMIAALAEVGAHLRHGSTLGQDPDTPSRTPGAPSPDTPFATPQPPVPDTPSETRRRLPDDARERANELLAAAKRCAGFLLSELRGPDGSLLRSWRDGRASIGAYLEDHAYLLEALLALYEATFEERWLVEARQIAERMIDRFADEERGGFFSTASDAEPLIARRKDVEDTPIPSGCSSAALGLLRLAAFTGESRYERHALSTLSLLHEIAPRYPSAFGHLLQALRLQQSPSIEVAIVGPPGPQRDALVAVVRERLRPNVVLAVGEGAGAASAVPLLQGREQVEGRPAAYVCERFACKRPVTAPEELRRLLS